MRKLTRFSVQVWMVLLVGFLAVAGATARATEPVSQEPAAPAPSALGGGFLPLPLSLGCATAFFLAEVEKTFHVGASSIKNPGSHPDWPLREQGPLFRLLGDVAGAIGVTLSESFVMLPTKSVSGILFPTDSDFASCQLCPREECPNRRAPYDPGLFERRYASQGVNG